MKQEIEILTQTIIELEGQCLILTLVLAAKFLCIQKMDFGFT